MIRKTAVDRLTFDANGWNILLNSRDRTNLAVLYFPFSSHNTNSTAAHEPVANASSSHHGTSSVSYQNLPGASSTQDNLSTSTSSSHSNDREELKTSAICIRDLPSRSTGKLRLTYLTESNLLLILTCFLFMQNPTLKKDSITTLKSMAA